VIQRPFLFAAAGLLSCAAVVSAGNLETLNLEAGRTDANRLATPVYETPERPVVFLPLAAKYDRQAEVVRRLSARVPRFTATGVDFAALLTSALQAEGSAMGLRVVAPERGAAGYTVEGSLNDVFLESKPVLLGPILFYGFLDVSLSVRDGEGPARPLRYRVSAMYARFNGGFGVKDEVEEVVAELLLDGAQEIVARLNREVFHAFPHPTIQAKLAALAGGAADHDAELRAVALSGAPSAAPALLALLTKEPREEVRAGLIDALAILGDPAAVEPLAARYAKEDEDCRFFTLKLWDAVGSAEARELIAKRGKKDDDAACQHLAARIGDTP